MRATLLLAALLLSGCLAGAPPPEGAPAVLACPRVELLHPDPARIVTASEGAVRLRVTNCLDGPFAFAEAGCREGSLGLLVEGNGLSLHATEGQTYDGPRPAVACEGPIPYANLSPGESRDKRLWFNGGYSRCDGAACPFQQFWAPAGSYRLVATLRHENGSESRAEGNLSLLPPEIPPADPSSDTATARTTPRAGRASATRPAIRSRSRPARTATSRT